MRRFALLVFLIACERDQPRTPPTPVPPPPGPTQIVLTPAPIPIDRPRTVSAIEPTVRVSLTPTELFVDGVRVLALDATTSAATITSTLIKELPKPTPDSKAIVAADNKVMHGTVVAVMDGIKQAGYTRLAIETPP